MAWHRTSRQSRGYDSKWDRLRLVILRRDNNLCQCNQCKGGQIRVTLASEVDHVVSRAKAMSMGWSKAKTEHPDNLQAINTDCHKRKTIEEQGGELKPKTGFDLAGNPTDPGHAWYR